ncbi:PAAR domain-containing protein [Vibrio algivorus]|uniref:PAAR domain-containing protein n=1 Tax=Vibrio algivorus TaxID=1667024 RepID=A0A557NUL6_9VIBR|nr:PAAR domain-containing protein [Vibrio algivorus]TVO32114.1 PAAR domain-containing protein [Vibrio algivorus]
MKIVTKGAATTTGGVVIEGHDVLNIEFKPVTVVGQKATCGSGRKSCKGVGEIVPLTPDHKCIFMGIEVVLDRYKVLCNCDDNFVIANVQTTDVGYFQGTGRSASVASSQSYSSTAQMVSNGSASVSSTANATAVPSSLAPKVTVVSSQIPEPKDPHEDEEFMLGWGMCQEEDATNAFILSLFESQPDPKINALFRIHNQHLTTPVRKGDMYVMLNKEPTKPEDIQALNDLKFQVQSANAGLKQLSKEERAVVIDRLPLLDHAVMSEEHNDQSEIKTGYPFLANSSAGIGVLSTAVGQRLKDVSTSLNNINDLYMKHVAPLNNRSSIPLEFYAMRQIQFKALDNSLERLTMAKLDIPQYHKIAKTLNLSTKSIVHHSDEILKAGYASQLLGQRIEYLAKLSKGVKSAGYVGVALEAINRGSQIVDACSENADGQCKEVSFTQGSGLAGSVVGGTIFGLATQTVIAAGTGVLITIGVTVSAPVVGIVSIVAVTASSFYGGNIGGDLGESVGKWIYKTVED